MWRSVGSVGPSVLSVRARELKAALHGEPSKVYGPQHLLSKGTGERETGLWKGHRLWRHTDTLEIWFLCLVTGHSHQPRCFDKDNRSTSSSQLKWSSVHQCLWYHQNSGMGKPGVWLMADTSEKCTVLLSSLLVSFSPRCFT